MSRRQDDFDPSPEANLQGSRPLRLYTSRDNTREPVEGRRSRSPISSHVVPQFPYSSQLVQPLPAAPELLPSTNSHQASPRVTVDLSDLPSGDKATALIEHFEFYSNAAFPILHTPALRRDVRRIYESSPVTIGEACCVLCETQRRRVDGRLMTVMFAVSTQSLSKRSALYDTLGIRPEGEFPSRGHV